MIKAFKIHIPEEKLDDLRSRIKNTRWPDSISQSGWQFGADINYIRELADYWVNSYDWRKTEDSLNSYPNFLATVDGYDVHFMHIKGSSPNGLPLMITHGWPYSVLEMMKIIPLLTSGREFQFNLIIPSLMGFGFSQKVTQTGCNAFFMAELWHNLMTELGYSRFGLQGGDFGAGVSAALAYTFPESVIGLHMNYIPGIYEPDLEENLSSEETEYLKSENDWYDREGSYSHQQRTRPLTLAYSLNDSPVGLCAWIVEKMYAWADCNGNVERVFTKDELLSNVTLYWLTETIHSSIRLYNENSKIKLRTGRGIKAPAAIARFRFEEPFPPRNYVERGFKIKRWTDFPEGGHFPAMEQPALLAKDIIDFFRSL